MDKNKTQRAQTLRQPLTLLLFTLVILVMVLYVGHNVSCSMEEEQLLTMETVSEKITSNMADYFDRLWTRLDYIAKSMGFGTYDTTDDILQMLAEVKEAHGLNLEDTLLILVDTDGYYYTTAAGRVALWKSFSSSTGRIPDGARLMLSDLAELDDHLEKYICLVKDLEEPLTAADGTTFPYIILATNEDVFEIDLSLGNFGTVTEAFVMNSNGRKVSTQTGELNISKSYNILSALAEMDFPLGDSYEEMVASIQNGESGASLIRYQGERYFIAHHPIGIEDWNAVFIMDKEDMADRITPLIYHLVGVLSIGFLSLIGIIIVVLLNRNRTQMLNTQLRSTADAAERANAAKSEFLSRMSHDIRTPLNGIIGMTAIAEKSLGDDAAVAACLEKISVASDHLLELVGEVLELSRVENGKVEVRNSPQNLNVLINRLYSMTESRTAAKNLTHQVDTTGLHHPYVLADPTLLNQILLNVVGNAIKYTPDGGMIRCKVYDKLMDDRTAEYHFVVSDTGIGMSPEFVEHIFDRFAQEEIGARTYYEGTGLGMAITKELVDLLGGRITVESEKGVGSTFEVTLTFELCAAELIEVPKPKRTEPAAQRQYHVLLAEDNDLNREIAEELLKDAGVSCYSVEDGLQAVRAFEVSEPGEYDAILMDIMMPNMDGHEATRTIRAMERPDARTIPILALSANAYREDREKSIAAGMNAHLTKPMDMAQVLEELHTWCDKEKSE